MCMCVCVCVCACVQASKRAIWKIVLEKNLIQSTLWLKSHSAIGLPSEMMQTFLEWCAVVFYKKVIELLGVENQFIFKCK